MKKKQRERKKQKKTINRENFHFLIPFLNSFFFFNQKPALGLSREKNFVKPAGFFHHIKPDKVEEKGK